VCSRCVLALPCAATQYLNLTISFVPKAVVAQRAIKPLSRQMVMHGGLPPLGTLGVLSDADSFIVRPGRWNVTGTLLSDPTWSVRHHCKPRGPTNSQTSPVT
jgi:hypothetical protein